MGRKEDKAMARMMGERKLKDGESIMQAGSVLKLCLDYIKAPWCFDKAYEKAILIVLSYIGLKEIVVWIYQLL